MSDRFSDLRILRWHDRISNILAGMNHDGEGHLEGPIRAAIDLTNLCNHDCPWCEPQKYREETVRDKRHTLPVDVALGVLEDLRLMDCKTVNFSGGGEPLLHPDFGTILRFAARAGFRTWVVTNGRYIDKWAEDLALASHVRVSLDASTPAEHEAMHGAKAGEFVAICQNIRLLCKLKGPEVGISYIVADVNASTASFLRTLEFADSAGVDFIHFRPLSEPLRQRFTGEWADCVEEIELLSRKKYRVRVFIVGKRLEDVFTQREFSSCYAALTTAVIGANGDCQACCDERGKVYGNVNEQSFGSLWLSQVHRQMATAIEPKLCQRCLMCGFNRAVEKYVVKNDALPELV